MLSLTVKRMASHRVAVLLAGSGVYDGSEVHEASAALVALSRHNAQVITTTYSSSVITFCYIDFLLCSRQATASRDQSLRRSSS